MESLKCPECGAALDGEGAFCKYCGAKMPDNVHRSSVEINDIAHMEQVKLDREKFEHEKELERKKKKKFIAKLIVAGLVLIGLAVAAVVFPDTFFLIVCPALFAGAMAFLVRIDSGSNRNRRGRRRR